MCLSLMNTLGLSSSVCIAHIACYWKGFLVHYILILCQCRLCKAHHDYLTYLMLQRQLSHLIGRKLDPNVFLISPRHGSLFPIVLLLLHAYPLPQLYTLQYDEKKQIRSNRLSFGHPMVMLLMAMASVVLVSMTCPFSCTRCVIYLCYCCLTLLV
jgi:hypothetical protein